MDFPRGNAADVTFGTGSTPGPSPEAVAVVAQRLLAAAAELRALTGRLELASAVDWNSRAAAAFREDLLQCQQDVSAAGRGVEDAATLVGRYGVSLAAQEAAGQPGGLGGVHS